MQILILVKSGPTTGEAERALATVGQLLTQGHSVALFLLQEAVHLGRIGTGLPAAVKLRDLIEQGATVHLSTDDLRLRGFGLESADGAIRPGTYDQLIRLMETSDRVIGLL